MAKFWKVLFLSTCVASKVLDHTRDFGDIVDKSIENVIDQEYTVRHFEWGEPNQWVSTMDNTTINNEIIACTISIPNLCVYVIPNLPGFHLFYGETMLDFVNDDQWNTINVIHIAEDDNVKSNDIGAFEKRFSSEHARRRRLREGRGGRRQFNDRTGENWEKDEKDSKRRRKRRRQEGRYGKFGMGGLSSYGCFNAVEKYVYLGETHQVHNSFICEFIRIYSADFCHM